MPTGIPNLVKEQSAEAQALAASIAELQGRLRLARLKGKHLRDLERYIARRPGITKRDVLAIAKAMPTVRNQPGTIKDDRQRRPNGDLGDAIKAAREAKGFTKQALAKKLGVNYSSVGYWERGNGYPDPKHHKKLSGLLNIPVARFVPPAGPRAKGGNNGRSTGKPAKSAAHAALGRVIAAAREAQDLSPPDMAAKLKVSTASVYGWEAGYWSPKGAIAERLAKLLAVPVERVMLPWRTARRRIDLCGHNWRNGAPRGGRRVAAAEVRTGAGPRPRARTRPPGLDAPSLAGLRVDDSGATAAPMVTAPAILASLWPQRHDGDKLACAT